MTHPLDPVKPMNIHNIRIDGNTQSRVSINQTAVLDYSNALSDGEALPPVTVFFDGVDNWLADGFHRYFAYLNIGRASIPAKIKKGTQRDAIMFGFSANNDHGLRPTTDDKAKSVRAMLNDPEWAEMSDRAIARIAGCSHPTVAKMRIPEATKPVATGKFTTQEPQSTGKFTTECVNRAKESAQEDAGAPDDEEMNALQIQEEASQKTMQFLLASDEPLADLAAKNTQLEAQIKQLELRIAGLQNANKELIQTIKRLQNQLKKVQA